MQSSFNEVLCCRLSYVFVPSDSSCSRVVSLSWVGFLAQAGGLIGACLGFSFISAVELVPPPSPSPPTLLSRFTGSLSGSVQVYWFLIRFCRLSKDRKRREALAARKEEVLASFINTLHLYFALLPQ